MAHTFLDPDKLARLGTALVSKDMVLAQTVNKDYAAEFNAGKGATVDVRIPATLTARTRTLTDGTAITLDDLTETTQPVSITEHAYSAVKVTDADLTLNIAEFGRQVLSPQSLAVAERVENVVVTTMQGVAETVALDTGYAAATPEKTFVAARKLLRDMGSPMNGLVAAVGTQIYADLLNAGALKDAGQSGSSGALRDAIAGRVAGFTVIESNRLGAAEIVFYHRDAVTLVLRAPIVPAGVSFGASVSDHGTAMRWIRDYDASILADRSIVSTFIGAKVMNIKLSTGGTLFAPILRVNVGAGV